MAELVDAPDSKSGGGDTVWVRFPLRAPEFYLWTTFEFLQQLRLARRIQDSRRGPFTAVCVYQLRHGPLQEPTVGSRLRARVAGQGPAVPPCHRTSLGVLDGTGRIHGKRRDLAGRGGARMLRGGAGEGRDRLFAGGGQRDGRQSGTRDVSRQIAAAGIRSGTGESGGGLVRRGRDPVGAFGVSGRRIHLAQVLRGPQRRARGLSF